MNQRTMPKRFLLEVLVKHLWAGRLHIIDVHRGLHRQTRPNERVLSWQLIRIRLPVELDGVDLQQYSGDFLGGH